MDLLRIMRRQTWQQIRRSHLTPTGLQRQNTRQQHTTYSIQSMTKARTQQLHTRCQTRFTQNRPLPRLFQQTIRRSTTTSEGSTQHLSLSQRMKKLSREYGWSALGVYLFLTALDFPFCFLAVRLLGTDRIGHWEHVIVSKVKEWIPWPRGDEVQQQTNTVLNGDKSSLESQPLTRSKDEEGTRILDEDAAFAVVDHGFKEANEANKGANASIWTQLAFAYAIHKSFIFIRVPLTAALTPKVVKTLRSWGYNIGKRPTKTPTASST